MNPFLVVGVSAFIAYLATPVSIFLAKKHQPLLMSLFFLIAGLMNYVGFTIRAFNLRFFWPITLAPIFTLPIYMIVKKITKNFIFAAILSIALFAGITYSNYNRAVDQEGFMNKYIWQNLQWIKENTPENSTVYFGFGDLYDQDAGLGNAHRVFYRTETEFLVPFYQQKNFTRYLPIKLFSEAGAGLPHKAGFLKYSLYYNEIPNITNNQMIRDICAYNYYLYDRVSQYPELVNYSLSYAESMMKSGNFEIVYANDWSVILRNNRPGEDCLD